MHCGIVSLQRESARHVTTGKVSGRADKSVGESEHGPTLLQHGHPPCLRARGTEVYARMRTSMYVRVRMYAENECTALEQFYT